MIRNTRDVSGWRHEHGRRLNDMSMRADEGRSRMTRHPDGRFA